MGKVEKMGEGVASTLLKLKGDRVERNGEGICPCIRMKYHPGPAFGVEIPTGAYIMYCQQKCK